MHDNSADQASCRNALGSIRNGRAFPQSVFAGSWDDYLFFESDRLFHASFIGVKNAIMDAERSTRVCMINLGHGGSPADSVSPPICLDRLTGAPEYMARLRGDGSPSNWLFLMDRYVCASDVGGWCIYCEKENDLAVLAIQDDNPGLAAASLADILQATSIRMLGKTEPAGHFSFRKLVPQWRDGLARHYCQPSLSPQTPAT